MSAGNPDQKVYVMLGDRFLSSAGAGENCALSMRLSSPSPVLDKNSAPLGPEILSSTGAGVWRNAPMAFSDSSSVLDKFQSAICCFFFPDFSDILLRRSAACCAKCCVFRVRSF